MDGGHTWIELDTSFLRCNLNYNIISTESGIYFSNNGNMNVFSTDYYNCVDLYGLIFSWIDSNIAMMTLPPGSFAFPSTLFSRSIDGGITWSTINPKESLLPFGIYYSQYWSKLFTAPLEFTADTMVYSPGDTTVFPGDTTKIRPFISFDKGTTWEFYGNWPQIYGHWLPTGDVEGAGKAVYVQSAYVPQNIGVMNGLWRSMDGGKSWQNIGGPSNYCHTRFSVLGCNGEIVIAYDVYGEIWETTDGGDGSLSEMIPSKDSITFSSQYCTPSLDTIIITVQNCNEDIDTFSFIKITSLDSMLLDSGILQILPFQSNPMLLTLNVQDSFTILWSPLNKFKTDTTIHAKVLFWYYSYLNDTTIADTLQLSFIINMPKSLSYIFNASTLNFGSVSSCANHDTTINIINTGCDTLWLDNGFPMPWDILTLNGDTLSYPYPIPAGDSISLLVRFIPPDTGIFSNLIGLEFTQYNISEISNVELSAQSVPGGSRAKLSFATYSFPTRSTCSPPDSVPFTVQNIGCDTLTIVSDTLIGDAVFNLPSHLAIGALAADSSSSCVILFSPLAPGAHSALVVLVLRHADDSMETDTITITGTVIDSARNLLAVSDTAIAFPATNFCISDDTTIQITNLGCDSITIWGVTGATPPFALDSLAYPFVLAPGASESIAIFFNADSAGAYAATLHVLGSDSIPHAIVLSGAATGVTARLTASLDAFGAAIPPGFSRTLNIHLTGTLPGVPITEIDLTIGTNAQSFQCTGAHVLQGTLLSFVNRDSIAHLRIGFPNTINLAQPIANVTIEGFYNVPDSSPITLAIDRIVLRDTMLPANCTVASNAIGTIGIVSFCGGTVPIEYVPSTTLSQNYPNPFAGTTTIHVTLAKNDVENAVLCVYNVLGQRVANLSQQLSSNCDITLAAGEFAAGVYYYVLQTRGGDGRRRCLW